ncbi:MAG: type IV pilin protein [Nitrospinales bacterium]
MEKNNHYGFTMIELLIVVAIISILAAISIPQYSQYKNRANDADAKSSLHSIFLSCKSYWTDSISTNDCNVAAISTTTYGYVQATRISVSAGGDENTFLGTASSIDSPNVYTIDPNGNIT